MSGRDYGVIKRTLRDALLELLLDLGWHDYKRLSQVGGLRYGARILELKRLGYKIESREIGRDLDKADGKEYRLMEAVPSVPQGKMVKVYLNPEDVVKILAGTVPDEAARAIQISYASYQANKEKL